jgi:hypothetical protein
MSQSFRSSAGIADDERLLLAGDEDQSRGRITVGNALVSAVASASYCSVVTILFFSVQVARSPDRSLARPATPAMRCRDGD